MNGVPDGPLRGNIASWCVSGHCLPAAGVAMIGLMPVEPFDPLFHGQSLKTIYFDTTHFLLRKARKQARQYLTLRLRCYESPLGSPDVYALSAKTESEKWRQEIDPQLAEWVEHSGPIPVAFWLGILPPNLQARLIALVDETPLVPVVQVCCHRYAVEDAQQRLTLDVHTKTDRGKCLDFNVLEFKSTDWTDPAPGAITALQLRPLKLSKFLWSTET
jgi:hypothetical protein